MRNSGRNFTGWQGVVLLLQTAVSGEVEIRGFDTNVKWNYWLRTLRVERESTGSNKANRTISSRVLTNGTRFRD